MPSRATLLVRHLDGAWGLRAVRIKGGKARDIPLPRAVTQYLHAYVQQHSPTEAEVVSSETPLFGSNWGLRRQGKVRHPITGKNIWRLCKTYGRLIGYPMLKPHNLRYVVTMEILEERHDLEAVRAMLGHKRIDTTQVYAQIRAAELQAGGGVLRWEGAQNLWAAKRGRRLRV